MKIVLLLVTALALVAGCKKKDEAPQPPPRVLEIPQAELKRGIDACKDYVAKVCKCAETVQAAAGACKLARAYPDAIDVGMQTVGNTRSEDKDIKDAAEAVRKTMTTCIQEAGQLPALGCPP